MFTIHHIPPCRTLMCSGPLCRTLYHKSEHDLCPNQVPRPVSQVWSCITQTFSEKTPTGTHSFHPSWAEVDMIGRQFSIKIQLLTPYVQQWYSENSDLSTSVVLMHDPPGYCPGAPSAGRPKHFVSLFSYYLKLILLQVPIKVWLIVLTMYTLIPNIHRNIRSTGEGGGGTRQYADRRGGGG